MFLLFLPSVQRDEAVGPTRRAVLTGRFCCWLPSGKWPSGQGSNPRPWAQQHNALATAAGPVVKLTYEIACPRKFMSSPTAEPLKFNRSP